MRNNCSFFKYHALSICFFCFVLPAKAQTSIQWASKVLEVSSERSSKQNSAGQVLGHPSVFPQGGNSFSAWEPANKTNSQYIKIGFKKSMKPRQIIVAENWHPGAVSRIFLIDENGKEHLAKKLKPGPVEDASRILHVVIKQPDFEVTSVKLTFALENFEEMPQIDAIGMTESEEDDFHPGINLLPVKMAASDAVNLGPTVNTPYKEVAPVISPDNKILYFTRDCPENIGGTNQDIWYSEIDSSGNFKKARNLGEPVNNERNNYASAITPDGQTMLVGNVYSDDGNSPGSGLSITRRAGQKWSLPTKLLIHHYNNRGKYTSAFLANDGKTLLFAITRDDTYGGEDIYVSFQDKQEEWSQPLNLGPKINSASDEYTPFLASDLTTLYFTSEGQPGFGKGDIYMSKRLDNSWKNWTEPVNLGPAFNTSLSDFYFTIPASGEYAYLVSATHATGATDIFRVKLPAELQPNPVVLLKGRVLNSKTNSPVAAQIHYETLPQGEDKGMANAEAFSGKYKIVLPPGSVYGLRASKTGFFPVNDNIDLQKIDKYVELEKDLYLVPIEIGQTVRINNLFFESRKSDLTTGSFPELNRLAQTLKQNPSIEIEIGGHTDDIGSEEDNQKLSQQRADRVRQYLYTQGVQFFRMLTKGYGESQPLASNDSEEHKHMNRRVEFKILKK